ncbi:chemotaxis protein CheA [Sessilibacter corallicola]|uniref:Chemotaxis protein CheA n=1 Tax=Sessilibacter corallicola TaxID=2904075 RepID=A0ABQ0ABY0_9GAMM
MSIDLQQFHQVFFEESYEGLDAMEQALLAVSDQEEADPELINTIFRSAHSIKGGSATLGFPEIASFTHVLETLLDEVREGKRELTPEGVELFLQSCDAMRGMIACLESNTPIDTNESKPLLDSFEAMLANAPGADQGGAPEEGIAKAEDAVAQTFFGSDGGGEPPEDGPRQWKIIFKPEPQILLTGNEPIRIFRELEGLGELSVTAKTDEIPEFQQLTLDECFISWEILLTTESDKEEIESAFDWVLDECELSIEEVSSASASVSENAEQAPASAPVPTSAEPENTAESAPAPETKPAPAPEATAKPAPAKKPAAKTSGGESAQSGATSIRVGIDKVDNLINLVGELVITQSMLSELGNNFDLEKLERLSHGLEQLKQNTRELQENVMRIRMLPISFAFNRFPRMIRDLSNKTGKKVELVLMGEHTELDKTVMEQIGDPLVHLVRNAVDHGLEMPDDRVAAGKDETGKIVLAAEHKGGNIVIEISDDGRGMDAEKILGKAREKGIVSAEQELSDQEIYELIFEPGFSTAAEVSDLSGRGVGMDVVRRNIKSLGGRIEIESEMGKGSCIRVHLPLTLAILDGQLVRVGNEVFIVPLVAIVESLQIKPDLVNRVSGNMELYRLREDNVPIIPIYREFNINADNTDLDNALLVVVEGEGSKIGLLVDDLLAQQQVVIKSLESNYRRVDGISGATILGDGSVALILDIPGLISSASQNRRRPQGVRAA